MSRHNTYTLLSSFVLLAIAIGRVGGQSEAQERDTLDILSKLEAMDKVYESGLTATGTSWDIPTLDPDVPSPKKEVETFNAERTSGYHIRVG